jgi:transposase
MYPSDLKDNQWELIKDLLPQPRSLGPKGGRPPADQRLMLNGMLVCSENRLSVASPPQGLWPLDYGL